MMVELLGFWSVASFLATTLPSKSDFTSNVKQGSLACQAAHSVCLVTRSGSSKQTNPCFQSTRIGVPFAFLPGVGGLEIRNLGGCDDGSDTKQVGDGGNDGGGFGNAVDSTERESARG